MGKKQKKVPQNPQPPWLPDVFSFTKAWLMLLGIFFLAEIIFQPMFVNNQIVDVQKDFINKVHNLRGKVEAMEQWVRKEEVFDKYFVEYKTDKKKVFDETRVLVKNFMEKEFDKNDTDGIGKVEFVVAAGPLNLSVVMHPDDLKTLKSSYGLCFCLPTINGSVVITLKNPIVPEAITLEHDPKCVAYGNSNAPKDCTVFGWLERGKDRTLLSTEMEAQKTILLAKFKFDLNKSTVHTFKVYKRSGPFLHIVDTIRIYINSNHGNPTHTCIYRLRLHGYRPDSLSTLIDSTSTDSKIDWTLPPKKTQEL